GLRMMPTSPRKKIDRARALTAIDKKEPPVAEAAQRCRNALPPTFFDRKKGTCLLAEGAGSRDAMTKITAVHTAPLLPRREPRTSLRRSPRSRKQTQPGLRRLRSERYPYR